MNELVLSAAEHPELLNSINELHDSAALCEQAIRTIEHGGISSAVNGIPAKVTPWFRELDADGIKYFARLAQYEKDEQQQLPFVVLAREEEMPVTTHSPGLITFKETLGHISLVVSNGLDPLVDDERYISLVNEIITDIGKQYHEHVRNKEGASVRARKLLVGMKKKIGAYFSDRDPDDVFDFEDKGMRRKAVAIALTGVGVLGYGHLPFTNADAEIGPIPMPQPIELLVDWNNMPDHRAQSFGAPPEEAKELISGEQGSIPMLTDYNTEGAPSGFNGDTAGSIKGRTIESKPGLYRFKQSDTRKLLDVNQPEKGCIEVTGSFQHDQAQIFTQDNATAEHARYEVLNSDLLRVCLTEGAPEGINADFYIWSR